MNTIYRCTGSCHGVSPKAQNCAASTCDRYDKPLVASAQCSACEQATAHEGKVHGCENCRALV